jgi:hypothetical protein
MAVSLGEYSLDGDITEACLGSVQKPARSRDRNQGGELSWRYEEGKSPFCFLLFPHDSCNLWHVKESNDPTHLVDFLKFHRRQPWI